jgi:peptide/nickel transport system permease protein
VAAPTTGSPATAGRGPVALLRRARLLTPAGIVLLAMLALAVVGPAIAPFDPIRPDAMNVLQPPSATHWFGTDQFGFDIYSRVLHAARVDLSLALVAVLIGGGIGSVLGALAALVGGWVETALLRLVEVVQSFPVFLFGIALFAAFGDSMRNLVIVIAAINVPLYLRQVRAVLLPLRNAEFILAARCAGLGTWSILRRHMLPNSRSQILSLFALTCAYAIQIIAGLSFIGLGIEPPYPEWGSMINTGASYIIQGIWWPSVFPGLAIVAAVFGLSGVSGGRSIDPVRGSA